MKRQGFTLVELSIVLVIIGLLIGGILAAQSMISTAKIQSVIRQLQQYDIAITNFQTKYNQIPGDSNLFTHPGFGLGNNNGLIEYGEAEFAWAQLSEGVGIKNYLGNNFDWGSTPYTQASCPQLNIDQDKSSIPCLLMTQGYSLANAQKNYYVYYMPLNQYHGNASFPDPLKARDTLSIDQKVDDGKPSTGKIMAETDGLATLTTNVPLCTANGVYNASAANYSCTLYIEIGSSGNSQ